MLGRSSWRRKCGTQSCAVSRPTTPDNISLSSSTITLRNLSASRSNFRWSYFGGKENSRGGERQRSTSTSLTFPLQWRLSSQSTQRWTLPPSPPPRSTPQPQPRPQGRPPSSQQTASSPTSSLTSAGGRRRG